MRRLEPRQQAEVEENRRLVWKELERRDYEATAWRWCTCHSRLGRRNCTGPEHHSTWTPERCELRICEWCARRQAAIYVRDFCEQLETLNRAHAFERGRSTNRPSFKLLTLTLRPSVPTVVAMREDVRRAFRAWTQLQRRLGFERDKREKLFGALAAVEIGPRRNVHLHVLYWGRFVPQQLISDTWKELTGDSYIVDIRELRGSWRAAVEEVTKYVTKVATTRNFSQSREADLCVPEVLVADIFEALKGRRRIATYGIFYNVAGVEEVGPRTCEVCGAALVYVMGAWPEDLHGYELRDYLHARAGPRERAA